MSDFSNYIKVELVNAKEQLLYGELFYPLKVRLNYLDFASFKADYLIWLMFFYSKMHIIKSQFLYNKKGLKIVPKW